MINQEELKCRLEIIAALQGCKIELRKRVSEDGHPEKDRLVISMDTINLNFQLLPIHSKDFRYSDEFAGPFADDIKRINECITNALATTIADQKLAIEKGLKA